MFISGIALLFFLKYFGQPVPISFLFGTLGAIYIGAMVYYTGGVNSSFIIWIITLPIVAILITIRIGLVYYATFLGIAIYITFLILGAQGIETPNLIPTDQYSTYNVINQILIMITVVAILLFYYYQNQSYNQQLETSNENLERFASVASHDMKAPLRNIVSFSQLLKRKLKNVDNEDALEYLGFIERNGKQMSELIQGILDFSKVQTENDVEWEQVDLNEVMADVEKQLKTEIHDKNATLDYGDMPTIQANQIQITQVFLNLVSNGLKYNRSENPIVKIRCQTERKQFEFFVEDNGIGIKKEYFEKIFEMFQRLNSAAEFQGTGIGLSICKKIATLHGGDLSVLKSSPMGTTFKFSLPRR
jgi:signal transduction histidine kinase